MLNIFGSSGRILPVLPLTLSLFTVLPVFAVSDQTTLALPVAPLQYCTESENNLNVALAIGAWRLTFVASSLLIRVVDGLLACPPGILITE
jgi:hypothetical protein